LDLGGAVGGRYWFTWRWLGWGIIGGLAGQGLLVLGVAVFRVIRESRSSTDDKAQ
jgi:hypothetical protein